MSLPVTLDSSSISLQHLKWQITSDFHFNVKYFLLSSSVSNTEFMKLCKNCNDLQGNSR